MNLIGDVRDAARWSLMTSIDTAGTLVKTADALLREGATQVFAACTHAVLLWSSHRTDPEVQHHGDCGHRLRAAERSGEENREISILSSRFLAGFARSGDSYHNSA